MWGNAVKRDSGLSCGEQGITAVLRFTAGVCGNPGKMRIELGGGHKVIAAANHHTGGHTGANVNRGEVVHVVERPGGHHGASASGAFLGRLEDQFDGAIELRFILLKHVRQPQTNGGVAIVAAGVHHPRVAGGKPVAERAMAVIECFA